MSLPTTRAARDEDVAFLLRLRDAAMEPHHVAAGVVLTPQEQLSRVRAAFTFTQVVEDGGHPVGMIKVVREGRGWRVQQFQVLPAHQGRGIGRAVLGAWLARADRERRPVTLAVLKVNTRARRLYERLGFGVVGEDALNHHMRREPAA